MTGSVLTFATRVPVTTRCPALCTLWRLATPAVQLAAVPAARHRLQRLILPSLRLLARRVCAASGAGTSALGGRLRPRQPRQACIGLGAEVGLVVSLLRARPRLQLLLSLEAAREAVLPTRHQPGSRQRGARAGEEATAASP